MFSIGLPRDLFCQIYPKCTSNIRNFIGVVLSHYCNTKRMSPRKSFA